ncbi:hypothetical protein GCM10009069_28120 [Algimonas arctica]|uniref:Transposase n=1 Tax=Algimonas arctica TaxID=1479486 RepID=A0A8J3CU56_9PROT|nr:hypothetical protein GCM10009069_28120 [Algimonas arctica]
MTQNPFRYFKTSREIIQLDVMMYVRFPLSLRNVEGLLHERGIDVCHESVRLWVDRFGLVFAMRIRKNVSLSARKTAMEMAPRCDVCEDQCVQLKLTRPLCDKTPTNVCLG